MNERDGGRRVDLNIDETADAKKGAAEKTEEGRGVI